MRRGVLALVLALILSSSAAIAVISNAYGADPQGTPCGIFNVNKNEVIAGVKFPKGNYQIYSFSIACNKVLGSKGLFTKFLKQKDKDPLPNPWRYLSNAVGAQAFTSGSGVGFRVQIISTIIAGPSPSASVQPTLSISERWLKIDLTALKVFNEWATKELPKAHSVKIEFVLSDKVDQQAVEELKRRYDLAARFWAPYSSVTNDFKVLIANHNESKWICELKLNWLQINQPDCEEVEGNGRSNIPTAGQVQVGKRNVDMYQVKDRAELDTGFFLGRVEHEFTHNIFYEQSKQYQNFMPCWQIEGGAEFFGIMIATRLDANAYIQARNIKFETDFLKLNELSWTLEDWIKFLNEIDRSDLTNRQGDTCGPVRPKIYAHSVLANEYLVQKVGIPGYLKLIRDAGNTSWAETIRDTFKVDKQVFYREMAIYMMSQYRLARENRWSYEELRKVPYGR